MYMYVIIIHVPTPRELCLWRKTHTTHYASPVCSCIDRQVTGGKAKSGAVVNIKKKLLVLKTTSNVKGHFKSGFVPLLDYRSLVTSLIDKKSVEYAHLVSFLNSCCTNAIHVRSTTWLSHTVRLTCETKPIK